MAQAADDHEATDPVTNQIRNNTLEEVAKEFDAMKNGGDTTSSFAVYVRSMKK